MTLQPQSSSYTFMGLSAVLASPAMLRVMELVERVARSTASVLITGESGAGKEMVARAVHYYSERTSRPWVDLSCAALPEHLLESELFGHERGAFSGADSAKPGLFELADKGTIFLDEIAELDPRLQVKLLRVLDGVPYYRLGGVKKVSTDVRVVAATNRDLFSAVAEGRFRSDLFHRLSQLTITVPPLRERLEDIRILADMFLNQHDPRMRFSDDAVRRLEGHSWPGNIRELRNTVLQAAILCRNEEIGESDLELQPVLAPQPQRVTVPVKEMSPIGPAATNLDNMERRMIFEALRASGGHQQRAAEKLGISRRTLSRKLKQYETELERIAG